MNKIQLLVSRFFRLPAVEYILRKVFVPNFIYYFLHFIHKTSRIKIIGGEHYAGLCKDKTKFVYGCWHGQQFSSLYHHRGNNITVMVSPSRDGDVQHEFLTKFGYGTIRGSSNKNPLKALISMIREAKKNGNNFAFAVDGPRGPLHKVKSGIAFFAQKTGYKILPIVCGAKFKITLKTWDRCIIPLPFNTIYIMYGEPIIAAENGEPDEIALQYEKVMIQMTDYLDTSIKKGL